MQGIKEVELSGYLGRKYSRDLPLHLSCTLTLEQSYAEVEGDSASVVELLSILFAISEVPLKEYIAIIGSIDQMGNVQPVGGVKEKVEGFYKVCKIMGLRGVEGVVVPRRNDDNPLLSDEVLESIEKNQFHIYAVDHVDDVIEILAGMRAQTLRVARPERKKVSIMSLCKEDHYYRTSWSFSKRLWA